MSTMQLLGIAACVSQVCHIPLLACAGVRCTVVETQRPKHAFEAVRDLPLSELQLYDGVLAVCRTWLTWLSYSWLCHAESTTMIKRKQDQAHLPACNLERGDNKHHSEWMCSGEPPERLLDM